MSEVLHIRCGQKRTRRGLVSVSYAIMSAWASPFALVKGQLASTSKSTNVEGRFLSLNALTPDMMERSSVD